MSSSEDDVSIFIWIFQFCSFLIPINENRFRLKNITVVLWSVVHFGLVFLELFLIYLHQNETFHHGSTIGTILDVIQVILPIMAHMVLVVESAFNWNVQLKMWECIRSVEKRTKMLGIKKESFLKTYLIEVALLEFISIVTEALVLVLISIDVPFLRSWYLRLWSLYMIRFGLMQLIFYLNWIGCFMKVIRMALINAPNCDAKLLKELQGLHSDIWLFSVRLNKRFCWSILALMVHLFITIIITFYWITARLYFHVYDRLFAAILISIAPITNLLVLLYACQQCISQATHVGHSLHKTATANGKINSNENRSALQASVRNFSLQVKLLPISLYGWGFFKMDFPFLVDVIITHSYRGVITAIASYLLLIFSLNPGSF